MIDILELTSSVKSIDKYVFKGGFRNKILWRAFGKIWDKYVC